MGPIRDILTLFTKNKKETIYDFGYPVKLVETSHEGAYSERDVETVYYNIVLEDGTIVGKIDLRLGMNDYLYYLGQVGYFIMKSYRGHNYAYYACLIIFEIAKNIFLLDNLIITCSPDNIASRKTLTKLNGTLIETVEVPYNHELYWRDEKIKCIFK